MYIPESTQKYNLCGLDMSHSDLAMKAAKGMGRSRQKTTTGHIVCRHLLDMLAEPPDHGIQRRARGMYPAWQDTKQFILRPLHEPEFCFLARKKRTE